MEAIKITVGMNVTNGSVYGEVEKITSDNFGNSFALVGWGKEIGLYNNDTININRLRILNW